MSVRAIITEGFGSFGTIPDVVKQGYGIGLAAAAAGIALDTARPPTVDFVFQSGWYARNIYLRDAVFPQHRRLFALEKRKEAKRDNSEMREMMELYSQWRKAA